MSSFGSPLPFSAHNIELSDGSRTIPDQDVLLSDRGWLTATLRTLEILAPKGERLRIVDLGCLEGGYSIEFARRGHEVIGIDARQVNIDRAVAVQRDLGLVNVSFVVDDVKNLAEYGQFDVVFCSGLLYHLDNPGSYLELIGRIATRALILNTHYAREIDPLYDDSKPLESDRVDFSLSKLTNHEGLSGRWYAEYESDDPRSEIEGRLWAAFSNERSFWPTKRVLLEACREAGFSVIYEQHDFVDSISTDDYSELNDRGMFVCIKPPHRTSLKVGVVDAGRRLCNAALGRLSGSRSRSS